MFRMWLLIMLMFVGGAVGFLGWLTDFMHHREFATGGRAAIASPVAKSQKPGRNYVILGEPRFEYPVRFTTEAAQQVSTMAYVPKRFLDQVAATGAGEVIYLQDDPQRLIYPGDLERMPKSHGSLVFGLASLLVGLGLITVRHRIAGAVR